MLLKILAVILFSLICVLPGSRAGFFDGLPLSPIEIYFSFFVFLTIFLTPWENIRIIKKMVFASLALFLILQFFSYKFLPYGWSVCVHGEAGKIKLQSQCEPTTEDPSGKTSYVYDKIDFTSKNMPLYFMNKVSFNYYEQGEPDRNSLPYIIEAQTYVYPQKNEKLIIQSEKNVLVKINEEESVYTDIGSPAFFNLVPEKVNHIFLKYDSNRNKNNRLEARIASDNFYKNSWSSSIFSASLYRMLNFLILFVLFFCLTCSLTSYFLENKKKHRYILAVFGIILLVFFILTITTKLNFKIFFAPFSIILFSASVYYLVCKSLARKKVIPFLLLIFFLNSAILTTSHLAPTETAIFSGGGDELGHESFSRSTFSVTNFDELLHSTENNGAYYYQPLHRYLFAILHKILGESLWGPYLFQTFAFSAAILFLLVVLKKTMGWLASGTFLLLYFLFSIDLKNSAINLMQSPLQQGIPLILIIFGIAMISLFLFKKETRFSMFFFLGIIFGISFMVRTDWLPIASGLLIFCLFIFLPYFQFNKKFLSVIFLIFGLSIFPLFIGFRNLHVASEFSIIPSTGTVNLSKEVLEASDKKIIMDQSPFSATFKTVISNFSGRYGQLAKILMNNIKKNMIGKKLLRKIIWYSLPALIFMAVFIALRKKLYYLLSMELFAVFSFFPLILASSLFLQHNGIAMLGIYDLLAIFIFAISIEIILSEIKTQPSDSTL